MREGVRFRLSQFNRIVIVVGRCTHRGISSTVRRCIEKETGREFAAKIIDLAADSTNDSTINHMMDATRQEIAMLRHVMGHPYISKYSTARARARS